MNILTQPMKDSFRADLLVGLPTINVNEITLGDSLELCERIPAKTVDLILEDMPYNTTACGWDKKIDLELYWKTRLRILKPTGVVVLTASQPFTAELLMSNKTMFKYEWIWKRDRVTGFLNAKIMPMKEHESILVFAEKIQKYYPIKWLGRKAHKKGKIVGKKVNGGTYGNFTAVDSINDWKYPTSILEFDRPHPPIHPTQKPVGLFEYLIRTYTDENDLVFDGFGGSGTTAIACHRSKRNFIVIEKGYTYYDLATKRLDNERTQLSLL